MNCKLNLHILFHGTEALDIFGLGIFFHIFLFVWKFVAHLIFSTAWSFVSLIIISLPGSREIRENKQFRKMQEDAYKLLALANSIAL